MVLNTIFLVREIRRNEQHDSFINAVTHELKTPVASIRLYLQTLQTRELDDGQAARVLPHHARGQRPAAAHHRAGAARRQRRLAVPARGAQPRSISRETGAASASTLARTRFHLDDEALAYEEPVRAGAAVVLGDADELKAAVWNLIDNAVKYSPADVASTSRSRSSTTSASPSASTDQRHRHLADRAEADLPALLPHPGASPSARRAPASACSSCGRSPSKHGGRAFAESAGAGQGSTFTLLLPKAPGA